MATLEAFVVVKFGNSRIFSLQVLKIRNDIIQKKIVTALQKNRGSQKAAHNTEIDMEKEKKYG